MMQPDDTHKSNSEQNPFSVLPIQDRAGLTSAAPASGTRWMVLVALCLLSGILYLDRICISAALPSIKEELKLDNTQVSYILNAFVLAYGLFEVPTGRWGDRLGARRVLTRISLWWSAFTALTGACTSLVPMMIVRFLFGAGEAGAFPNSAKVISRWFPEKERGRAQGIHLGASQIGGAIAPFLATVLITLVGWRLTFVIFGCVGVVWAWGFHRWFRDAPSEHPDVSPSEAAYIAAGTTHGAVHEPVPWWLVAKSRSVWWLSVIMICASFNAYIYFSWFTSYLIFARGIPAVQAGAMSSFVLAGAAVGTLCGGLIVDVLAAGSRTRRRLIGCLSFIIAAVCLGLSLASDRASLAVLFASMSCFATQATQPLWWTSCINISGPHVGSLTGLMNSAGVFGAMASQSLVGMLTDHYKALGFTGRTQWDPIFYVDIFVLLAAAVLWATFSQRVVEDHANRPMSS